MEFTNEFINYLENNIGDKVNEVFFEAQKELGITNGDISPLHNNRLTQIQSDLLDLVKEVLTYEMEEQKRNEPKHMYINYYSKVSEQYETIEVYMALDAAKDLAEKLYTEYGDAEILDKELADNDAYDPFIAVFDGKEWRE